MMNMNLPYVTVTQLHFNHNYNVVSCMTSVIFVQFSHRLNICLGPANISCLLIPTYCIGLWLDQFDYLYNLIKSRPQIC